MTLAVSQLIKQQQRERIRSDLAKPREFRIKTNGSHLEDSLTASLEQTNQSQVSIHTPHRMQSDQLTKIRANETTKPCTPKKSLTTANLHSPKLVVSNNHESSVKKHLQLHQSPKLKSIRKLDSFDEYEATQTTKFKTVFKNASQEQSYMIRKVNLYNHLKATLAMKQKAYLQGGEAAVDHEKKTFLDLLAPKDNLFEIQKNAIKLKYQKHMEKYEPEILKSPRAVNNLSGSVNREGYYMLCKSLNVDKLMTDRKERDGELSRMDSERKRTPERDQELDPELSSVLKTFRETNEGSIEVEKSREMKPLKLPPVIKEKNIHVERLRKFNVRTVRNKGPTRSDAGTISLDLRIISGSFDKKA